MKVWSGTGLQFQAQGGYGIIDDNDVVIVDGHVVVTKRMLNSSSCRNFSTVFDETIRASKQAEGCIVVWDNRQVTVR